MKAPNTAHSQRRQAKITGNSMSSQRAHDVVGSAATGVYEISTGVFRPGMPMIPLLAACVHDGTRTVAALYPVASLERRQMGWIASSGTVRSFSLCGQTLAPERTKGTTGQAIFASSSTA